MMAESLGRHHPPPTPPSDHADLHLNLHQIAQYNAEQHHPANIGSNGLDRTGPSAHVVVPYADHISSIKLDDNHFSKNPDSKAKVHGDGLSHYESNSFDGLNAPQANAESSPPTPTSAAGNDEFERRTRSGRALAPPTSHAVERQVKTRVKATPKSRKPKAGKGEKPKAPKLTLPLSILTKDMTSVPMKNIEELVNRPAEERRKEAEGRNGYITRPMNSFMLYRSAYAERTKEWSKQKCLQNNHQVVSSLCGESWNLEPPEVRELFNEYAKIERINHQNAHPDYKFSPSKASVPVRRRRDELSDEEPSDLDDAEYVPGQGRSRSRPSKRQERDLGYAVNASETMNAVYFDRGYRWELPNAGRPLPMPVQGDYYHHYYPSSGHPNMGMAAGVMEEMHMRRISSTGLPMHYSPEPAMLGLPGGNAADMMQHLHSAVGTPLSQDGQVDPMLLAYDGGHPDMESSMMSSSFQSGHLDEFDRDMHPHTDQSFLASSEDDFHTEHWHPDPTMITMEQGSEFEKWMEDHHAA
ncbi:uncharacterized protein EI97DRAFT_177958 [Westerdykella ornata]|uniref:HMG box domain-containing protein n=1 Tax=Westerdykella ornata TaxID=318751 RepID=A0A6A6JUJ7_WESOR|nr:uncharacterized protein EI97DRAFT_177958 [Westerdykella ornata]KAF2279488.1 hypothetical protein EI97DRAFT_177958 [Westerdykella ornata]